MGTRLRMLVEVDRQYILESAGFRKVDETLFYVRLP